MRKELKQKLRKVENDRKSDLRRQVCVLFETNFLFSLLSASSL